MTNNFKERELKAPGYLDGIYILQWTATCEVEKDDDKATAIHPRDTRKRASGDKVAIQFKYCSHQLGLSKRTFRDALHKSKHHVNECWINTLYDNTTTTITLY